MLELPGLDHTERARGMVMRRPNHDRFGSNTTARLDLLSCRFHYALKDDHGVRPHQRHPHRAIVKYRGPHLALIMKALREIGQVISRHLHPDIGRDVALGKSRLQEAAFRAQVYLSKVLRDQGRWIKLRSL